MILVEQSAFADAYKLDPKFVDQFPYADYAVYSLPDQRSFYVDYTNDYIKGHIVKGMPWEQYIDEYIEEYGKPNSVMIDIGAHIGTHTLTMSRVAGNGGRVFSFEPQKKICRELHMNLTLNKCENVIPINCALGNQKGVVCLGVEFPHNEGARYITEKGCVEMAQIETLDSFNFSNVSLIKIDAENFELQVLEGARETILRNRPTILIEIMGNHRKAREEDVDLEFFTQAIIEYIKRLGYEVKHLYLDDYIARPLRDD